MIVRELRSELVRLRRPGLLVAWVGLTAGFAALVTAVVLQVVGDGTATTDGPGVVFPTAAELAGPRGPVLPLGAGASFFGVVALACWAVATATDHSTGLVRLLVAAQPRRWRLLAGKVAALSLVTAATAALAVVVGVGVAPVAAEAAGTDTSAWGRDVAATLAGAWVDLTGALLVWGVIGLALAVVTRSAAVAIGAGVGYVLVVEPVVGALAEGVRDVLPGTTLSALASGGSSALDHATAAGLGAAYVAVGLATALVVLVRRDVTD